MTVYRLQPLKLDRVQTHPLRTRPSKVTVAHFATPCASGAPMSRWLQSLPHLLAAESFRAVVEALERARSKDKPIIWGIGGHVIKCGLGTLLIDLMKRGYLTAFAMNGASLIHDFEIALVGATSEDVPVALGKGRFGMADETGRYINKSIAEGDSIQIGLGEAAGRFLAGAREARFRNYSVLATAYRQRVPVTVHATIGADVIHQHPSTDARALGATSYRDFLLLAALVREMEGGGVYLNVGSAVILPEVFLKCISLAANLGRLPRGITTVNMDFIQHYRPQQNVLIRPTAGARLQRGQKASRGYALTGHHELMIPLLAAALGEPPPKRGKAIQRSR